MAADLHRRSVVSWQVKLRFKPGAMAERATTLRFSPLSDIVSGLFRVTILAKIVFSSDRLDRHLGPGRRARAWVESLMDSRYGFTGDAIVPSDDSTFFGETELLCSGTTAMARSRASHLIVRRNIAHIARDLDDRVMLFLNQGLTPMRVVQLGREAVLQPGEGAFVCQENPQIFDASHSGDALSLVLPREDIENWKTPPQDVAASQHDFTRPAYRMLFACCRMLAEEIHELSAEQSGLVRRHIADLSRHWLGVAAHDRQDDITSIEARYLAIRRLIRKNLSRPDLDVRMIARTLGLSQRMVQHVLTRSGTSFAQLLNETRCRRAATILDDPACDYLSAHDIAQICGYGDYPQFFRVFKRYSGNSPSQTGRRPAK